MALARLRRALLFWPRSFGVAAAALLLLAGCAFWGFWKADLPGGDTSSYFAMASHWAAKGRFASPLAMGFSPLYGVFLAWMQKWFPDAGEAVAIHRILIVFAAALATLAALRRMLPASWAWITAAWWVAVNWHLAYEVHLFGYALLAAAAACAGAGRSPWRLGIALALLGADAVLVRNELLPAVALFAACCAVSWWHGRGQVNGARQRRALAALTLPSLAAALAALWLFSGYPAQLKLSEFRKSNELRQRVNLSQVYAFGYQQRHPEWSGDPWRGGASLMQHDFGRPDPTLAEAARHAPAHFLEHVLWNFRLLPAGLQEGIFGYYSGRITPDFFAWKSPLPGIYPLLPTLLGAGCLLGGAALAWQRWRAGRRFWLAGAPGIWSWILLACCLPTSLIAIATQRPRPSYMFPLSLLLMASIALSLRVLCRVAGARWRLPAASWQAVPTVGAACLFAGLCWINPYGGRWISQPLLDDYHRIHSLRAQAALRDRVLCSNADSPEDLVRYLTGGTANARWKTVPWAGLNQDAPSEQALAAAGATDLYLRRDPTHQVANIALGAGWTQIAAVHDPAGAWEYWSVSPAATKP